MEGKNGGKEEGRKDVWRRGRKEEEGGQMEGRKERRKNK